MSGLREFVRVNLEMRGRRRPGGVAVRTTASRPATTRPPDLILLDVMMPQVDGWEMLRRVQEQYGVGPIPVVMFSGKVDEQARCGSGGRRASSASRSTRSVLIEPTKLIAPV